MVKTTINSLQKIYRRQIKLNQESRFERWKAQCINAEPKERWKMITKWTRPRARTYNFTPFELQDKAKQFWQEVYRVGTQPMSEIET